MLNSFCTLDGINEIDKVEELSIEQKQFLEEENKIVKDLFSEENKIEVYAFDENTTREELFNLFYG